MVLFDAMSLYLFALLPIPVQILIAFKMHKRKQHILYPAFWSYLWFESTRLTAELILRFSPWKRAYFYIYWSAGFISVLFILAVLREIFSKVLADYSQLSAFRRLGYEITLAIVVLSSVALSAPVRGRLFFSREIIQIQQAVGVVATTMLIFVTAASFVLGIRWRSELCGIAAGVGLLGMGDVVTFTMTLLHATYNPRLISWIESVVYDAAFILLAAYFAIPQEQTVRPVVNSELVQWAHSMSESLRR